MFSPQRSIKSFTKKQSRGNRRAQRLNQTGRGKRSNN